MTRRRSARSAKTRQNRFVNVTTAARFTASEDAISPAASLPSVPTGPAVAALFSRQTDDSFALASAESSGARVSSMRAASARSKRTKR